MEDPAARWRLKSAEAGLFDGALREGFTREDRRRVREDLERLLAWHRDLAGWRRPRSSVEGVPFVALYARGKLVGCFGAEAVDPGERLVRAFLRSAHDTRFGGVPESERGELAAEAYYARDVTPLDPARIEATFELGTHGLGVRRAGGPPVVLLPSVARDNGYRAASMLESLVRKARLATLGEGTFFTFEVESVVARMPSAGRAREPEVTSVEDAAAAWLASLVQPDGSILFSIDARSQAVSPIGEMHHARTAAAVQALARHGGHARRVARARDRLAKDARSALEGRAVAGWPDDEGKVAGTLAHLVRAGVSLERELGAMASRDGVARASWHAAQVATALGPRAPASLVDACVRALGARPWAPWTVLALAGRDDPASREALGVAVRALVASVRADGPHRGSVNVTPVPEVAVTALTVEALRSLVPAQATGDVRAAIERGLAFVASMQLTGDRVPAAFAPEAATGAFLGSPITSLLRADVTAHACLASPGGAQKVPRSPAPRSEPGAPSERPTPGSKRRRRSS